MNKLKSHSEKVLHWTLINKFSVFSCIYKVSLLKKINQL